MGQPPKVLFFSSHRKWQRNSLFFESQRCREFLQGGSMSYENEAYGDEDTLAEPSKRDYELALEQVVETIMLHGMWPAPKRGGFTRSQFDLYDFLNERRDSSYFLELYIAVLTGADIYDRKQRETKTIEAMLADHFRNSEIVETLALDISRDE
jgi:hypothetical protein